MNIEIRKTKKNPILFRDEISAEAFFEGQTPSRQVILKDAAKKLGCKEELLTVNAVKTLYGQQKAEVGLYKYDSKEHLDRISPGFLKMRNLSKEGREAAKAEAKKAEEQKEGA